jgi:hypothetical protein
LKQSHKEVSRDGDHCAPGEDSEGPDMNRIDGDTEEEESQRDFKKPNANNIKQRTDEPILF